MLNKRKSKPYICPKCGFKLLVFRITHKVRCWMCKSEMKLQTVKEKT